MPISAEKIESVLAKIEAKYTRGKKFDSLAKMFSEAAMADIGLMSIDADGSYKWNENNSYNIKSYDELLKSSPAIQHKLATDYIHKAETYIPAEIERSHVKNFSDADVTDSFLESLFVKGARGAVRDLAKVKGVEVAPSAALLTNQIINTSTPTTSAVSTEPKKEEVKEVSTITDPITPTNTQPAIDPNSPKVHELKAVNVYARRPTLPGTNLTHQQVFEQVVPQYDEWYAKNPDVTSQQQLDELKKLYKDHGVKGGVIFKVDKTDKIYLKGTVIEDQGIMGIYAARLSNYYTKMEAPGISPDEMTVGNNTGEISGTEQLYLALVAKNKGRVPEGKFLPADDKGEVGYSFKASDSEIATLLKYMPKEERAKLADKELTVRFNESFTVEKYQNNIKNNATQLDKGVTFLFNTDSPNAMDLFELFGYKDADRNDKKPHFSVAEYGRNFPMVNTLIESFSGATLNDYKKHYFFESAFEDRASYAVRARNLSAKTDEEKTEAQKDMQTLIAQIGDNKQFYTNSLKAVSDLKYSGGNDKIIKTLNAIKLISQDNLALAEFDTEILNAKDSKEIISAAKKYDQQKHANEVITFDTQSYNLQDGIAAVVALPNVPEQLMQFIKAQHDNLTGKPWLQPSVDNSAPVPTREEEARQFRDYEQRTHLNINPLPPSGISESKPLQFTLNGGTFKKDISDNEYVRGTDIGLNVKGAGVIYPLETDKLNIQANANISIINLHNYNNDGKDKILLPLEKNPVDYTNTGRQNLDIKTTYRYDSFNEVDTKFSYTTSPAFTARKLSVDHNFLNTGETNKTLGVNLPGEYSTGAGDVNTKFGANAGISGTLYLTGDQLKYSFNSGISQSTFKPVSMQPVTLYGAFLSSAANLTYIHDNKFSATAGLAHDAFAPFGKNGFSNITTSFSAKEDWDKFSLSINGAQFNSKQFNMFTGGMVGKITFGHTDHTLSAGFTKLQLLLPNSTAEEVGKIINFGYDLQFKKIDIGVDVSKGLSGNSLNLPTEPIKIKFTKTF